MNDDVVAVALDALRAVYDPELGLDVVTLGLIYRVTSDAEQVHVDMTLTTPGCPVSESLPQQALETVTAAVASRGLTADVRVVWDPPWTPAAIEDGPATSMLRRR